jgi:cholesterol oxidase
MAFDVIVIGSGFGGAVTACRLAEAGARVLVLERGRRWSPGTFPRTPTDDWLWDHEHPERRPGWFDIRRFPRMTVAQGAGVGGGSLVYANVSCEAPRHNFASGWPPEIRYQDLKPYYDRVKAFMCVEEVPKAQWTNRMKLMEEAAINAGVGDRFAPLELAVRFRQDWTYKDHYDQGAAASQPWTNPQGATLGSCVHLGNCDIGCDVNARNTLDLNYLYLAEHSHSADVRELHLVTAIEPEGTGYRVRFDSLAGQVRTPGSETAAIVIVAAGSLGSTELLLRCRAAGTLPSISQTLGEGWSSNGDFLTPAVHWGRDVEPSKGPTIGSAITFQDGSQDGSVFWIEDGGLPNLFANYVAGKPSDPSVGFKLQLALKALQGFLRQNEPFKNIMPWFAQGVDASDGRLRLVPGSNGALSLTLDWNVAASRKVFDDIVEMHQRLADASGGWAIVPPTWTLFGDLVTPHPLGGCRMGTSSGNGVVDHRGEVFGHPRLYVADGAIVPRAVGVNPSRTIAALAERIAELIVNENNF